MPRGPFNLYPQDGSSRLASYCRLVPRVFSSGGHTRLGGTSRFVNLYLKWAFVEAASCAIRLHGPEYRHARELYQRLQPGKGHGRAAVAVARHWPKQPSGC